MNKKKSRRIILRRLLVAVEIFVMFFELSITPGTSFAPFYAKALEEGGAIETSAGPVFEPLDENDLATMQEVQNNAEVEQGGNEGQPDEATTGAASEATTQNENASTGAASTASSAPTGQGAGTAGVSTNAVTPEASTVASSAKAQSDEAAAAGSSGDSKDAAATLGSSVDDKDSAAALGSSGEEVLDAASEASSDDKEEKEKKKEELEYIEGELGSEGFLKLSFDKDAEIPEGSEVVVYEITSDDENYERYINTALEKTELTSDQIAALKVLDISIVKDEEKVEPSNIVNIEIGADALFGERALYSDDEVRVVHINGEDVDELGADVVSDEEDDENGATSQRANSISFSAGSFSPFVIMQLASSKSAIVTTGGYEATVVYDNTSGIPAGTEFVVNEIGQDGGDMENYRQQSAALFDESVYSLEAIRAFDLSFVDRDGEDRYQPGKDISVTIKAYGGIIEGAQAQLIRMGGEAAVIDAGFDGENISFNTNFLTVYSVAQFAVKKTLTASDGKTYLVTVNYDSISGIPEGAVLAVSEITEGDAGYDEYAEKSSEQLSEAPVEVVRAFDISLKNPETGEEYQPTKGIQISIDLLDENLEERSEDLDVVHIHGENEEQTEVMDSSVNEGVVEFETDGLSVYVVVRKVIEETLTASDGKEYLITVSYDSTAGIPENAALAVNELTGDEYQVYLEKTAQAMGAEALDYAKIFDISIIGEDGTHYQPNKQVSVRIQLLGEEAAERDFTVVHFGEEVEVLDTEQDGTTISFRTSSFSVYSLGAKPLRTYRFFTYKSATEMEYVEYRIYTDMGDTTYTQIIKNASEKLVIPQLPSLEGSDTSTFAGWYVATGVQQSGDTYTYQTLSDDPFDFENIPAVTQTETVYLFAVFAKFAYVVFHDQFNGSTGTYPVAETRRGAVMGDPLAATIQISDVTVDYDDNSDENTAPSMAFYGWSETPIPVAGDGKDNKITTDSITISGAALNLYKHLYPIFQSIYWLNFNSGPTGSGATYIPSRYYYVGEGPTSLQVPLRSGYTFAGWYVDATVDDDGNITNKTSGTQRAVKVSDESGALINGASGTTASVTGGKLVLTASTVLVADWTPANVQYNVVIWRQSVNDAAGIADSAKNYDYAESFTLTGTAGQTVTVPTTYTQRAGSGDYLGFVYNASNSDTSKTLAADGSTVLNVRYDRVCYTFKMLIARSNNAGNGSFNLPYEVTENNRRAGWETAVRNASYNSAGNITSISQICTYPQSDPANSSANYGVWYDTYNNNRYYYYYIKANYGTSIVDLWPVYRRNDSEYFIDNINGYSLNSWKLMPTALAWGGTGSGTDTVKGVISVMDEQILGAPNSPNSNFMVARFWNSFNTWTYNLYFPVIPGETYTSTITHNGQEYYLETSVQARSGKNNTTVESQHGPSYPGFVKDPPGEKHANEWVIDYFYVRNSHNLEFWDSYTHQPVYIGNTQQQAISVAYDATLENYVIGTPSPKQIVNVGGTPTVQDRDGYNFTNWYADEACKTRVFFHQPTAEELISVTSYVVYDKMPDKPVKVYAGWDTIWYKVIIDPNYGWLNDGHGTGSTWFWEPYNGDPIQEYTHVKRDYVESTSGTYYYHYDDRSSRWPDEWSAAEDNDTQRYAYYTESPGDATELTTFKRADNAYRYAGWYEVTNPNTANESERLYNFGEPVTHDTYLRLHWKKIGTYYIQYNAVVVQSGQELAGTIDGGDSSEELFADLDSDDYADNAEVVVTRIAKAPEGYNFVGWKIRNDTSGTIYYPGQSFKLLAKYTATINNKETIFLDAVYSRIGTAKIIYDANGGSITGTPDYGKPLDPGSPTPTTEYDADAGTATIKNLVNNSPINLSDGTGFYLENATLCGWNTAKDASGTHYDLDGNFYVDVEDPITLYAEWKVRVYFYRTKDESRWGNVNNWAGYTAVDDDVYYTETYVNRAIPAPTDIPVNTSTEDNLTFRYWGTMRYTNTAPPQYDFSSLVTKELYLYAYWAGPIELPIHVLDTTQETIVNKDNEWLRETKIDVHTNDVLTFGETEVGTNYVNVPSGYKLAFTAAYNRTADIQNISESNAIAQVYYHVASSSLYVKFADNSKPDAQLADTDELYFIYYKDPEALDIGYKWMDTSRSLNNITVNNAPTTASAGTFVMADTVVGPRSYLSAADRTLYNHYAYAIGDADATSDAQLFFITSASTADNNRPTLNVRNTWRGFEYSSDGSNWVKCGYTNIQLYVVYFKQLPTVITLKEETYGTTADMELKFKYTVTVTTTTTTTTQKQRRRNNNSSTWSNYGTAMTETQTTTTTEYIYLADSESETITLFYEPAVVTTTSLPPNGNYLYQNSITEESTQTIVITQNGYSKNAVYTNDGYETDHDGTGTSHTSKYIYTYTTAVNSTDQTVTYTNIHTPLNVEVHVAMVNGNTIILDDDHRKETVVTDYTITLPIDRPVNATNTKKFLTEIPEDELFTGDSTLYGFAGIIYGTSGDNQGDVVTVKGTDIEKIVYGHINNHVYEPYFNDDSTKIMGENKVYYLYYPLPKIVYVKETSGGALERIKGSINGTDVVNSITYNRAVLTMNGKTVEQEQLLSIGNSVFRITQTVATGNFNMPPLLDDKTDKLYLQYTKLGAAGNANVSNTGSLSGVNADKVMYLKVDKDQVKWSFDNSTWNSFNGSEPTVYAIYKEKGYSINVTKTLVSDTGNTETKPFKITISSQAITQRSYEVTGTGYNTIDATPVSGSTPGKIEFNITNGGNVTIFGLAKGDYTITENNSENYTLTAKSGAADGTLIDTNVYENKRLETLTLNGDKKVALTNTRKYVEITVKKLLEDATDTNKFGFVSTFTDNNKVIKNKVFGTGGAETAIDGEGKVRFEHAHLGQRVLTVPVGSVLEIVEEYAKTAGASTPDVPLTNYIVEFKAVETANTSSVYNGGATDVIHKTYTLDTVPDKALTVTFTNKLAGLEVKFKKIDGFGNPLSGARFQLFTDAGCQTPFQMPNGAVVTGDSASGLVVLSEKVPFGVYYMKETIIPASPEYVNTNVYIVLVGKDYINRADPKNTGLWGGNAVLGNIVTEDITDQTTKYKADFGNDYGEYAIFMIDSDSGQAVNRPDIAGYGILNISRPKRKVILKKTDASYTMPTGAVFEILRVDMSPVESTDTSGTKVKVFTCGNNNVYFIDDLPYGDYYIHETTTPSGYATSSDGTNWFSFTVDGTGVTDPSRLTSPPQP